jgi:regulator of protease activity HflC (stomatin/prohibitin superfamily)
MDALIALGVIIVLALVVLARTVRIVPQARAGVVERLGRYSRTLTPGLALVVPFVDRVRGMIDLRETVVSFPPQPVITEDNLVVGIDTVIYYQVTDPRAATYEIANVVQAIEQLTVTTLRNVIGGIALEKTLTSRDQINGALRVVLDEATGPWGIRVNRVEIKAIDPPASVKDSMEKQMRADRDKRATILTAEGVRQSQILTAEGQKQSAILRAEGEREARILEAEGQAQAIATVFKAIHEGDADPKLLAYQYLQTLPQMAQGDANKVWIVPSDFSTSLQGFAKMLGAPGEDGVFRFEPSPADDVDSKPEDDSEEIKDWFDTSTDPKIAAAVAAAEAVARKDVEPPHELARRTGAAAAQKAAESSHLANQREDLDEQPALPSQSKQPEQ